MSPPDIGTYTGIPYSFRRYNCWTHVVKVRSDAGLSTPVFPVRLRRDDINATFQAGLEGHGHGLVKVSSPMDYDIVIFPKTRQRGWMFHAGVFVGGVVSHCSMSAKQVVAEPFSRCGDVEIWR